MTPYIYFYLPSLSFIFDFFANLEVEIQTPYKMAILVLFLFDHSFNNNKELEGKNLIIIAQRNDLLNFFCLQITGK